jgi:L-threonylcarbamoyladenylate synthase
MPILAPTEATLALVAQALRQGDLAALPTETVYGLAADAANPEAVLKIFKAKGRPAFNPLITHVPDIETAQRYGVFSSLALKLAEAFWPGPLTLVVKRAREGLEPKFDGVCAELLSISLRIPNHALFQDILHRTGRPLAAPSANISGHISATTPLHVQADFGPDLPILDGGPCQQGLESTVVDVTGEKAVLLRHGALPIALLEEALGYTLVLPDIANPKQPKAPGMLLKHYAPKTPVRLKAIEVQESEALLAFGPLLPKGYEKAMAVINLSEKGDLTEAATQLFAALRALDETKATAIAVMAIPAEGLGEAINDRLTRAAAGR